MKQYVGAIVSFAAENNSGEHSVVRAVFKGANPPDFGITLDVKRPICIKANLKIMV